MTTQVAALRKGGSRSREAVVELTGGLANQLFQWSAGYQVASSTDAPLILDASVVERPDGRGLQISSITEYDSVVMPSRHTQLGWRVVHALPSKVPAGAMKRIMKLIPRAQQRVADTETAIELLSAGKSVRLAGLFQRPELLYADRDTISSIVRTRLFTNVERSRRDYVAVHVRRGDYVNNSGYLAAFGVCSMSYYSRALRLVDPSLPIVFVSDDRSWCEDLIRRLGVEARASVAPAADHFEDLRVLSSATQLVLANSTFSWWGAYLGNAQLVMCPEPWFTDRSREKGLARSEWVKVPRE